MRRTSRIVALVAFCCQFMPIVAQQPAYRNSQLPVEQRVEDLLQRMTPHEKVMQLRACGMGSKENIPNDFAGMSYGTVHDMNKNAQECAELYDRLQDYMQRETRLGIPVLVTAEGIEGILQNGCTIFPHALAQGSTWNPDLISSMTQAAAREARSMGIRTVLSPVLDIARELRWGRVEETYGEDPFLIAEMGTAFVRGYQLEGVNCMPKHFVAHGTPSGGLNSASVAGGERDLQSLYLYPFRKVIERTQPMTVMSCYSVYDGEPVSGSYYYMTEVLRNQLGFRGFVYSDWGAVERLNHFHKAAATNADAALMALEAGVDLDVDDAYNLLEDMVAQGRVSEELIDRSVRRVLAVKFRLGLFDEKSVLRGEVDKVVRCKEHRSLAYKVAAESIVLLENKEHILPLNTKQFRRIAVVGPNADQTVMGDYSWTYGDTKEGTTLLQGLRQRVGKSVSIQYAEGCDWWSTDTTRIAQAVALAQQSDVVIAAIGTRSTYLARSPQKSTSGEGFDLSCLDLPGAQQQLLERLKATGKPVVVCFISGKPLAMPWVKDNADAFVVQWYGGESQGEALADALLGNVNPSGRLNVSFPRSTGNIPCFYNHLPTDRTVGFDAPGTPADPRNRYIFDTPSPLWAFGEGLSYTEFQLSNLTFNKTSFTASDTLCVTLQVQNTGKADGQEVVQLYVTDLVSSVATPVLQLKAFAKVDVKAGGSKAVTLQLPISELSLWNRQMKPVVEPGEFMIRIGSSSNKLPIEQLITVE